MKKMSRRSYTRNDRKGFSVKKRVSDEWGEGTMYSISQAWTRVGRKAVARASIYLAAKRGDFGPTIRLGKRLLIPKQAFEKFLGNQDSGPTA